MVCAGLQGCRALLVPADSTEYLECEAPGGLMGWTGTQGKLGLLALPASRDLQAMMAGGGQPELWEFRESQDLQESLASLGPLGLAASKAQ
mmetsp:Transcript_24223/g.38062  ORF Transcript_24223/g.38062 Transcript_24223/m.38062 type:complete len:91 (+) Transcript_24223:549-821(+)